MCVGRGGGGGDFCYHVVGQLHPVDGTVGAKEYLELLKKATLPSIADLFGSS